MPIIHQMIVITGVWYSSKSDWNVFHSYKDISFLKLCLKHKMFENQDSLLLVFRHFAEVITIAIQSDSVKLQTKKIGISSMIFSWSFPQNVMFKHNEFTCVKHVFMSSCVVMLSWAHSDYTTLTFCFSYKFTKENSDLLGFWLLSFYVLKRNHPLEDFGLELASSRMFNGWS